MVRFATSPLIAILVGALVGFLCKDRPALTAVLGLLPWTVMLLPVLASPLSSLSGQSGFLRSFFSYPFRPPLHG